MKTQGSGFFWPSFTDLMTSLFFIMLVLYVLTYLKLTNQRNVTEQQVRKIQEIQTAIQQLPREFFEYDPTYKRFSLVQQVEFERGQDIIREEYTEYLVKVGGAISALIDTLKTRTIGSDIKYVIIIEGMASEDDYVDNFPLSYKRAWAVLKLWQAHNIALDQAVCEVQVAGSGIGGIGRFTGAEEARNQRILIQIVPKIGDIKIE